MAVKGLAKWTYQKAQAQQKAAEARGGDPRNRVVGNFVDLEAVAKHLKARMDPTQRALPRP